MIYVEKNDESDLIIHANDGILNEINTFFSFPNPNARWLKTKAAQIKAAMTHMFRLRTKRLPVGLYAHLAQFGKDRGYPLEGWKPLASNISLAEVQAFINTLNLPDDIKPYEHQVLGVTKALRYMRRVLESSTSSGKSLIIYCIVRYLDKMGYKGLIIVPTLNLQSQIASDFMTYARNPKSLDLKVDVQLWQSIQNNDSDYFKLYDYVIVDEAHHGEARVLTNILRKCVNAKYKIGLTGSVKDSKIPRLVLEANFGPITTLITNKEAIDKGISTDLLIKGLVLRYPEAELRAVGVAKFTYQDEIKWLLYNPVRNNFICNLAISLKCNTLIMVTQIEHGEILVAQLLKKSEGTRKVYWVHGGTEAEDREAIRKIAEHEQNAIIVGSVVFQEGMSLRNLHNIIFTSPTKSKIRVLQMIGRGLRLLAGKEVCTLFDIVDDLRIGSIVNYTLTHWIERLSLYNRESFTVKVYNIKLERAS